MPQCESCGAELTEAEGQGPFCAACEVKVTPVEPNPDDPAYLTQAEAPSDTSEDATVMFDDLPDLGDGGATDLELNEETDEQTNAGDLFDDFDDDDVEEVGADEKPLTLHGGDPEDDEDSRTQGGGGAFTRLDNKTPVAPADSDKAPTIELEEKINKLWQRAEKSDGSPSATLHVSVSHIEGDSQLTVPARPIAYPETPTGARPDYQITKFLAAGGMGRVYTAQQMSLGRPVALKTLKDSYAKQERQRRKFVAEASITASLEHPNIIPIHDIGLREDGAPFYSMKFVEGQPWDATIKTLGKQENIEILMKVADAIAFAHSRKIIHRDLKPDNVMVGAFGEVLVADWGLAIHLERETTYSLGGTPLYMAPEMASNDGPLISERSDIYLLGAILFEVLEGRPPHDLQAKTATERLLAAAMNRMVEPTSKDELIDVALKALKTNPSDRYQTVIEFQEAIRECQRHADSRDRAERAAAQLEDARKTSDNEAYARAMFGFQDAIDLWPENGAAREGLEETRLAYAEHALAGRDFALGLSLLDTDRLEHQSLVKRLQSEQEQEKARGRRLKLFRNTAIGATAATLLALAGGIFLVDQQRVRAEKAEGDANQQRRVAEQKAIEASNAAESERIAKQGEQAQRLVAESNAVEAQISAIESLVAETRAEFARIEADRQRGEAERQRVRAVEQEGIAVESAERARRTAFVTQIALTTGDLDDANTATADRRLRFLEDPANGYAGLLDWEADRLRYMTHRDFAREELAGRLAAFDARGDGATIAALVQTKNGQKLLLGGLGADGDRFGFSEAGPVPLQSLACVATGPAGAVAVGGVGPQGAPLVAYRQASGPGGWRTIAGAPARAQITALAYSPGGDELAIACHEKSAVRVQVLDLRGPAPTLRNPRDTAREYGMSGIGAFSSLVFSADGRRLAAVEENYRSGASRAVVWSRPSRHASFDKKATLAADARSLAFHPTDSRVIACGAADGALVMFEAPDAAMAPSDAVTLDPLKRPPPIEGVSFTEHGDNINQVAFSRDGGRLATASQSGVALVWSRGAGPLDWRVDQRPPVRQPSALVGCFWGGSESDTLVTATSDGRVHAWPLDDFYNFRRFATTGEAEATSVVAGQSGLVVVGDASGHSLVYRRNAPNADPSDLFVGHAGAAVARVWSVGSGGRPGYTTLGLDAAGAATLCRWPASVRSAIRRYQLSSTPFTDRDFCELSPSGEFLAVGNLNSLEIRRASDQRVLETNGIALTTMAFLPTGERLAVTDSRGRVTVFKIGPNGVEEASPETIVRNRKPEHAATTRSAEGDVLYLGFAADRRRPAMVHRVLIRDDGQLASRALPPLPTPAPAGERRPIATIDQLACAGERVAVLSGAEAYAYQPASGEWARLRGPELIGVAPGDDGRFVGLTVEGTLVQWEGASPTARPAAAGRPGVEYSQLGRVASGALYAVGRNGGRPVVDLWPAGDARANPRSLASRSPVLLALPIGGDAAQQQRVATIAQDGAYRVWSLGQRAPRLAAARPLVNAGEQVASAAVSTDGRTICLVAHGANGGARALAVTPAGDAQSLTLPAGARLSRFATADVGPGAIAVWDAARGSLYSWRRDALGAAASKWTPSDAPSVESPLPVAVADDGRVAVVAGSGLERWLILSPPNPAGAGGGAAQQRGRRDLRSLAFSRSGDRLLAGAGDGRVIAFDVSLNEVKEGDQTRTVQLIDELTTFAEHRRPVTTLRFNPSARGDELLTGSANGRVLLWPTAPQTGPIERQSARR